MGVFTAAVPIFVVHVIGMIFLMAFNDLGQTLMTELQASILLPCQTIRFLLL